MVNGRNMEDRVIVDSILRDGKTSLFALVVKKYEGVVFSKAFGITKRKDAARELTQQTFIRTYTRLADFRGRELGPWIVAIACHLSLNHLEREKRQRTVDIHRTDAPSEEYNGEREAMLVRVEEAMGMLPDDDRALIRMHYYERRKTAEMAQLTGLSQNNILVRLHRIRERLKKILENGTDGRPGT